MPGGIVMSDSTSATRAATRAAERDDHLADRQALQAVQVSLDRRDNGGDGAAMLDK
jgi:hypothetical protein